MASDHHFSVRWVLLPALYAATTVPVLIASVLASFVGGGAVWAFFCRFICGSSGLLALLLIGAPVFGLLSIGLARVERLRAPTLRDHLRYCVVLYAGLVVLGPVLATGYGLPRWSLGWGLGVGLFLAGAYAVSVNAVVVYAIRQRSSWRALHRP